MNLYRIDSEYGPVSDFLGPKLIRRYASAVEIARATARNTGRSSTITRISGSGRLRAMATVSADGNLRRVR